MHVNSDGNVLIGILPFCADHNITIICANPMINSGGYGPNVVVPNINILLALIACNCIRARRNNFWCVAQQ